MSRPAPATESLEGSPSLKNISRALLPEGDGDQQMSSEIPGNHEEAHPATPVTGVSNLMESPVGTSSVGSPSAGNSPVDRAAPFMRTAPVTDNLKAQLNKAFKKSPYDGEKSFLPINELERIINEDSVRQYCSPYANSEPKGLLEVRKVVEYVFGPQTKERGFSRQVFAILVLIGQPALIPGIVEENIRDNDLPLAQYDKKGTDYQLARGSDEQIKPIRCFSLWTLSDRRAFDEIQFQVKPPVFKPLDRNKAFHPSEYVAMRLDNRTVLPFTLYDGKKQIISGSSKVVRVKIHDAHHEFKKEENEYFAMKTLESRDPRSQAHYRLEVKALMKIRAKKKPHLVDVLTTFKYDNKYHLLFRWASGGNLSNLWNRPRSDTTSSYESICWLAQQCVGLADGLDGIHNAKLSLKEVDVSLREVDEVTPSASIISPQQALNTGKPWLATLKTDNKDCGRHGDIKPPNILWFRQDKNEYGLGVLKISDFGLTTFHTALTTKISPREQEIELTLTYAAPEWDLKDDISRPFDIWSLGCVYLEFLTWALLGSKGILDFRKKRSSEQGSRKKFVTDNFYSLQGVGEERHAIVKDSVEQWIRDLKARPQCTRYMADFLDYIGRNMIVVDKTKRDKSSIVRRRLDQMFKECIKERNYALSSTTSSSERPPRNTLPQALVEAQNDNSEDRDTKTPESSRLKHVLCFCI